MQAYDEQVAAGNERAAKHVASLNLPGFYTSCIYKWKKAREADKWSVLCASCPKLARKYKEMPDILKSFMGKPKKFKHRRKNAATDPNATCMLPSEFVEVVASAVVASLQCIVFMYIGPAIALQLFVGMNKYVFVFVLCFTHVCIPKNAT